jgi:hypothetical protein
LIRQEASQARPALAALLAGRVIFTPRGDDRDRRYELTGAGTLGKVIEGIGNSKGCRGPTGSARKTHRR